MKSSSKVLGGFVGIAVAAIGCRRGGDCESLPQLFPASEVTIERDVPYGDGSHRQDVYSPPGPGPFPALIEVHGGGFTGGDKGSFEESGIYYASRGIVVLAINYTLAPEDGSNPSYPEAVQDVYCSIRSARANAGDLNVDPGRIALRGGSAGATLDNMVALGGDGAPFDGGCFAASQSARVQAVIDYFGAADFNRPINAEGEPPGAQPFLGPNPSQATIDEASPINYVSPDDPPYVIGHGTADRTVLISQSIELANALNDDGVPADLVRVKGAPHGFIDSFNGAFSRSVRCDEEGLLADTLQPGS